MDLGRVRTWEWCTGLAGVVLLVALFLPWYGVDGAGTATGWQSLSVIDVILALVALLAIAHPIVTAMQRTAAVPQSMAAFVVWMSLLAAILVLIRLLDEPSFGPVVETAHLNRAVGGDAVAVIERTPDVTREIGLWLATGAVFAIFWSGWRSMRDKRFPRALRPNLHVTTIATPAPDGEHRDALQ